MRYLTLAVLATSLTRCAQTEAVYDPANNKTVTSTTVATSGTLTLNLTTTNSNLYNQPFSFLLFQNGVLKGAQYNSGATAGTNRISSAGKATLILNGVDGSNCASSSPVTLTNGVYDAYLSVQYNAEASAQVNTGTTAAACGSAGYGDFSNGGNLYGARFTVTISGNTTYSVASTAINKISQHTFDLAGAGNFRCYVTDANVTTYTASVHLIGFYERTGVGTTTGRTGAATLQLPLGTYRYFCYNDFNSNTNFFEPGLDKYATGTLNVTGLSSTYIAGVSFANQ